jgi:hypothetical protein
MWWMLSDANDKKVTREEFRERVLPRLRERGFSEDDIRYVRAAIDAALNESGGERGVSEKEIASLIRIIGDNAPGHFSPENLGRLEAELRSCL